ncbi:MAG: ribonuclease HII [Bacteroidetes bacterium]|nr:ribonuclease HII [Bacteroidota bacterium]
MKELSKFLIENRIEAGCDEAGRGCLAGPVVAAAVILDPLKEIKGLNDSKQISDKKRRELCEQIKSNALNYSVAIIDERKIDELNILNASIFAMHQAIAGLSIRPEWLLIDGNRFHSYLNIPHTCVIKGDGKFQSIAAASILAKTYRDDFMMEIDKEFPDYNWKKNMGYPTQEHREAIFKFGATKYHRMTFKLLPDPIQLSMF